jgi:predicted ATP-grasp superfamily ATP-dependent carboligase
MTSNASAIGVVGASARAAVHSLARAGFKAWAVDLFADRDLKRVAPCTSCPPDSFPDALPQLAAQFPLGPVLYTGGLENSPHIVGELAATRELWGNPPDVLERVRDPHLVRATLGDRAPRLIATGQPCPTTGRWLRKPLRSSGGHGIRFAQPGEPPSPAHYFQEFIDGPAMSAVFVNERLFGVSQQLIGEPWLHAKPFAYCGNVGPVAPSDQLVHLGEILHQSVGIRSIWNVDFIPDGNAPRLVEVNPRYSASVEVIEHATGRAILASGGRQPPELPIIGKAIYYAPHCIVFPASGPWDADLAGDSDPWQLPTFADIPDAGAVIERGHPVLTIFAAGSSPTECRERLQSRAAELDELFAVATP